MPSTIISSIKAVIYDLDGTLINSESLLADAKTQVLKQYGFDTANFYQQTGIDTTGVRVSDVIKMYQNYLGHGTIKVQHVATEIIQFALDNIIRLNPIMPGAIESIKMCKKLGLRLALASSSPQFYIERVLDALGIIDYFEFTVSADKLAYAKPHPEVYLLTAKMLELNPEQCVAIEDSLVGMIASKAAKMRSIVIPHKEQQHESHWGLADIKLNTLSELQPLHLGK